MTPRVRGMNRLDRFFEISARESTVAAEIRGGVVTFIAMAYIIVLNPIILSSAPDVDRSQAGLRQVSAMTSLAAGVMTILFGAIARLPFAFAAGLGINSFLATTVVGSLTLARGDGPGGHQRPHHRAAGGDGPAHGWSSTPCRCNSSSRSRRVSGCSSSSSGWSTPASSAPPGSRRHRSAWAHGGIGSINTVPTRRLRVHPAGDGRPCRAPGAGRHPHRAGGRHAGRGRHRGDLASRIGDRDAPAAGACRCRRCRDRRSRCPTCRWSATSAWAASAASACSPRSCWFSRWFSRTSSTRWAPSPGCRAKPDSPTSRAPSRDCVRR